MPVNPAERRRLVDREIDRSTCYFTIGLAALTTYLVPAWSLGLVGLGLALGFLLRGLAIERR